MSEDFVSPKPTGSDAESVFHQETHELTRGPASRIRKTSTVWPEYTPRGIFLHARPGKGGSAPSPQTLDYFVIVSQQANYFIANNKTTGAPTAIAKPWKLQNSRASANIDTVVWTYAYNNTFVIRSATATIAGVLTVEYQCITPRWLSGDVIIAAQMTTGLVDIGSKPIAWQDLDNSRAWTRLQNQTDPGGGL